MRCVWGAACLSFGKGGVAVWVCNYKLEDGSACGAQYCLLCARDPGGPGIQLNRTGAEGCGRDVCESFLPRALAPVRGAAVTSAKLDVTSDGHKPHEHQRVFCPFCALEMRRDSVDGHVESKHPKLLADGTYESKKRGTDGSLAAAAGQHAQKIENFFGKRPAAAAAVAAPSLEAEPAAPPAQRRRRAPLSFDEDEPAVPAPAWGAAGGSPAALEPPALAALAAGGEGPPLAASVPPPDDAPPWLAALHLEFRSETAELRRLLCQLPETLSAREAEDAESSKRLSLRASGVDDLVQELEPRAAPVAQGL